MDLWLVAAATGAGYLAKYWQQMQSNEGSFELESCSSESLNGQSRSSYLAQHLRNQTNPVDMAHNFDLGRYVPLARRKLNEPGVASCLSVNDEHDCNNVLSLTSLLPGLQGKESLQDGSFSEIHMSPRRKFLKCRSNLYLVRPVNLLESCPVAQFHREHAKMDDYIYNSIQSLSTSAVRAFLVTDGSRIISRPSQGYRGATPLEEDEMHMKALLRLSDFGSTELFRRPRSSVQKVGSRRASSYSSRLSFQSQGSTNAKHLFLLGITIGIISATITHKRELGELNDVLKQCQNLADDLHEELEIKDSRPVEKLIYNASESTGRSRIAFSNGEQVSLSGEQISDEKLYDAKLEKCESMSKIEAELEAELERLGLTDQTSSLENEFEMDPYNVSDAMYGEPNFNNDRFNSDTERGTTGNQTYDAYYAVSPWELSLRLHEVIQSRLETLITELERTLKNSQKRKHLLESEYFILERNQYSETGPSTQDNLFFTEEDEQNADQPLLLNMSGAALAAYSEADDEIWNISANDDEKSPTTVHYVDNMNVVQEGNKMIFLGQGSRQVGTHSQLDISEERRFKDTVPS